MADDSGPRIKQSILASFADLTLRVKQARAIIAWHQMRPRPDDGGRKALRAVDDALDTPPVMPGGPGRRAPFPPSPRTQVGPFPPLPEHTTGDPPPWETEESRARDLFTDPERAVLDEVNTGAGNIEIGERLHLSPETIKTHMARMSRKLGVRGRRDMLAKSYRIGLIRNRRRNGP